MIKINLLSEGKRTVRKAAKTPSVLQGQDIGLWLLAVGLLLGVAAVAGYWWKLNGDIDTQKSEIAAANQEVERLAAVIKEVEDYKHKKAELERKIKLINDLKLNQRGPVRVMDHISRALPELLWLDKMTMHPNNIEIEGRAFNTNAVANFIENLDKVPEFEEPTLKTTDQQSGGIYKFVIVFNYSFAPIAAKEEAGKGGAPGAAAKPAPAAAPTSG
ncbi:MAG TPA: PilN domain-containing protein [Thermoanaerobaculia bacterium]|jgi:type IV pilus assembly protein PilN|nr:PilN domain-containing protein [Thermoanaerobaculia bacterium]